MSATEKSLTVLEFFAVGNYLTAVLFMLSRVAELFHNLNYLQLSMYNYALRTRGRDPNPQNHQKLNGVGEFEEHFLNYLFFIGHLTLSVLYLE